MLKNLTQNLNKILRVFRKLVDVIDAILNSLAKLIPSVDAISEFKDIYFNFITMMTMMIVDKLSEEVKGSIGVFQKYTINARCIKIRDILSI